jgi:hypothetical protein
MFRPPSWCRRDVLPSVGAVGFIASEKFAVNEIARTFFVAGSYVTIARRRLVFMGFALDVQVPSRYLARL